MSEPANDQEVPWLLIAVALLVIGVVVTIGLSFVDPPAPVTAAQLAVHEVIDVGAWEAFPDVATPDAGKDGP